MDRGILQLWMLLTVYEMTFDLNEYLNLSTSLILI